MRLAWAAAGGAAVASERGGGSGGRCGCPPQGTGPGFERALKRAARLVSRALGSVEPLWLRLRRERVLRGGLVRRELLVLFAKTGAEDDLAL